MLDSRGAGMEEVLKDRITELSLPIDIEVVVKYGARLVTLTNEAIRLSKLSTYDLILIL